MPKRRSHFLPSEAGEVSASCADGGVMSVSWSAHDPSAHCVGTSPSRTPRRGGMTEPSPFHRDVLYRLFIVGPAHVLPAADRAEADSADIGGVGAVPLGVVDEEAQRLLGHFCRRLPVRHAPLFLVAGRERLVDPFVELGILRVRGVARSDVARAVEFADPVIGVDVIGALPQRHHVVVLFAILHAALHDRPGRRFDLDLDADLLGAEIKIESAPWPVVQSRMQDREKNYDMVPLWKSTYYVDPNNWVGELYGSPYIGTRDSSDDKAPDLGQGIRESPAADATEKKALPFE